MDKAIIIAVNNDNPLFNEEIRELISLANTCDIEIVDTVFQNLHRFNPVTYVGKGKVEEIEIALNHHEVDLIICNDELSPLQISTLEARLDCVIYDRTFIILEIFKERARTKEAILQVELAFNQYELPRLMGSRTELSRQRGTGGTFARGRGAGEMKLELERRDIRDRVAAIKRELKELTKLRRQQRTRRQKNQMKIVSLVGYTNSGKSSTLNSLLNYSTQAAKTVFEKDMLFATLETATRRIQTESNLTFLLTDTVGFIHKLPHQLVEAFKSTLEEIKESDLIIHVVDSSNPNYENQIKTTNKVLKDIGVNDIPMLYAFNKIDLIPDYFYIPADYSNAIRISATEDKNLNKLLNLIEVELFKDYHLLNLEIPYQNAQLINKIKESAIISSYEETKEGYKIEAKVPDFLINNLKPFIK